MNFKIALKSIGKTVRSCSNKMQGQPFFGVTSFVGWDLERVTQKLMMHVGDF